MKNSSDVLRVVQPNQLHIQVNGVLIGCHADLPRRSGSACRSETSGWIWASSCSSALREERANET